MNFKELTVPKKVVYIIALVLAVLLFSPEKFAVLSSRGTQGNVGST